MKTLPRLPLLLVFAFGCMRPEVHPSFDALRPVEIEVADVRNATGRDLRAVSFAGLVEHVLGAESHDVVAIFRRALEGELHRRGYVVVEREAESEDGHSRDGHSEGTDSDPDDRRPDALLEATIRSWTQGVGGALSFSMGYRLTLRHATGGEVLYQGEFAAGERPRSLHGGPGELAEAIRRSVKRALADLPQGHGAPADDPAAAVPPSARRTWVAAP